MGIAVPVKKSEAVLARKIVTPQNHPASPNVSLVSGP